MRTNHKKKLNSAGRIVNKKSHGILELEPLLPPFSSLTCYPLDHGGVGVGDLVASIYKSMDRVSI